jgi:hypothetical protein
MEGLAMTVNVSAQVEARLFDFARQEGIDPATLIEKMVAEYRPIKGPPAAKPKQKLTATNDPLMARLEARIAAAPTDPEAISEAEDDMNELMRNMNASRAATGERIPFPGVV